jgi:Dolichyl-phosphate-mannose-protein mannosyltransferase
LECGVSVAPFLFSGPPEISNAAFSCNLAFLIEIGAFVVRKTDLSGNLVQFAWWALATIVFTLVVAIRIRLLGIPLERDEGEYAYAGQLILQGIPPYKLAYNMKFPGTYAGYALIMSSFGQTIHGIHLGLLLINIATIALIFLVGRQLINTVAGITAAASYAVLSVSPSVLGLAAHATNFVVLPVLGGILLLLKEQQLTVPAWSRSKQLVRLFASGLLFGIGALMKQPGLLIIPFGPIYIVWNDLNRRLSLNRMLLRILVFVAGAAVPLGITSLILWCAGVFDTFWFWTIYYARQYGSLVPLSQAPRIFLRNANEVVMTGWPIWMLAGIGALTGFWHQRMRTSIVFLVGFFFFSALAVGPGLYFRTHYFILVLPAVSLLAGAAIGIFTEILQARLILLRFVPLLLFAAALSVPILLDKKIFFDVSPNQACGLIYPENPFLESVRIGTYLREHSELGDTIAVLGSEPEIYFYSHRHSATGYIYTYGLMESQKYAHQMQEEMIREIEGARPKYLISVAMGYSWLRRPDSEPTIFTWANEYMAQNYTAAGFVNIKPTETDYFFGDVPQTVETLKDYILIYRRNL